jgi:hypothetical protein
MVSRSWTLSAKGTLIGLASCFRKCAGSGSGTQETMSRSASTTAAAESWSDTAHPGDPPNLFCRRWQRAEGSFKSQGASESTSDHRVCRFEPCRVQLLGNKEIIIENLALKTAFSFILVLSSLLACMFARFPRRDHTVRRHFNLGFNGINLRNCFAFSFRFPQDDRNAMKYVTLSPQKHHQARRVDRLDVRRTREPSTDRNPGNVRRSELRRTRRFLGAILLFRPRKRTRALDRVTQMRSYERSDIF